MKSASKAGTWEKTQAHWNKRIYANSSVFFILRQNSAKMAVLQWFWFHKNLFVLTLGEKVWLNKSTE
jgi:hypothetical protein